MKMKTNRKVKKLFSYVLTAAMVITAVTPAFAGKVKAVAAGLTLTEQSGWLESAYVEWQPVKNAEGYVAYVKEASASDDAYEKLDDTLIRQYADYWRADALGLKEGSLFLPVSVQEVLLLSLYGHIRMCKQSLRLHSLPCRKTRYRISPGSVQDSR